MDNENIYGSIVYNLEFKQAIERDLICDYKVIISTITSQQINRHMIKEGIVDIVTDKKSHLVALQNSLSDIVDSQRNINKVVTFHSSVSDAKQFTNDERSQRIFNRHSLLHVNGTIDSEHREIIFNELNAAQRAIISNARCLTEGVNIPTIDMVAFMSPKKSRIDIIQAIGRALRKSPEKTTGYIFIPIFINQAYDETLEEALETTKFDTVFEVLQSLKEQDQSFASILLQMQQDEFERNVDDSKSKLIIKGPFVQKDLIEKYIRTHVLPSLTSEWDKHYPQLVEFYSKYGHSDVHSFPVGEYVELKKWSTTIKRSFKSGKLALARINKLKELSFDLEYNVTQDRVAQKIKALKDFHKKNGHFGIKVKDNKPLYDFVHRARKLYEKGTLSKELEGQLNAINFDWGDSYLARQWQEAFHEYKEYVAKKDTHFITVKTPQGRSLSYWATRQRLSKYQGKLSQDKIKKLESIGFKWKVLLEWDDAYDELKSYVELNQSIKGLNDINKSLYMWVLRQRKKYTKGELKSDHLEKLKDIGFPFYQNDRIRI